MAWLQNLAGKAEDLLNKIDQNAATVLQDTVKMPEALNNVIEPIENDDTKDNVGLQMSLSMNKSMNKTVKAVNREDTVEILNNEIILSNTEEPKVTAGTSLPVNIFENLAESCGTSTKSDSTSNKYDEIQSKLEEKLVKLEIENTEINRQILNIQHLYSELKHENINLMTQLQVANDKVKQAQNEMELYKARAQRVLQEKEKLTTFKKEDVIESNEKLSVISNFNEGLSKELTIQEVRNKELMEKNSNMMMQIADFQQELVNLHESQLKEKQELQNILAIERKNRALAEEECKSRIKEVDAIKNDISQLQKLHSEKNKELEILKTQIKNINNYQLPVDMDLRVQSLTETLMVKQSALETVTSERNALKIQFEKLEKDYNKLLQCQRNSVFSSIHDVEEGRTQIPKLTTVSALDVGVKRKVKHTFSLLDAISIRTGVFLRRYPIARIFVLCYMILLHVWVLIILFTYVPIR